MARTAAMDDSAWRALLLSQGWTPGASNPASGSPAGQTPAQMIGLIGQGLAAGLQFIAGVHGIVTGVDPAAGTVTTAAGVIPIGQVGTVTGPGLNVTPAAEGFLDKPMNLALIGGGLLVLLLVLKK